MKVSSVPRERDWGIALVGTAVSDELCECSMACSPAGNQYQRGLIKGLEGVLGKPLHVISIKPVAMYPRCRVVFARRGRCPVGALTDARLVPFVNLPVFKQLAILMGILWRLSAWLWRERRSSRRFVLLYNCFSPFSLAVLAATTLFGGTPIAVVADLPHDCYGFQGGIRGMLERVDFFIQTHCISRFAAVIPLTQQIAEDFAPDRPALVVEGGVDLSRAGSVGADEGRSGPISPERERVVFYSGALSDISGIDLLVDAFRLLPDPLYRLHIFGQGPGEPLVREAAAQDQRVVYGGVLPNSEIRRRQAQATVLVNPRPSHRQITRYTFPSKVLEYLASGRPTITTVLPGIPEEYHRYMYLVRDETPEGLARAIEEACSKGPGELVRFGQQARNFVLREKSWERQGRRIHEFLGALE